jgi:hypothetical protein
VVRPAIRFPSPRHSKGLLRGLDRLFVCSAALYLLWPALSERPRALGDAGEYLLMTESLFNHWTPDLRSEDVPSLMARPAGPRIEGSFGSFYRVYQPDRTDRAYCVHFWAYSLFAVPAKAVLRWLGKNEFKAFQITNAVLFLTAVFRARGSGGKRSVSGVALAGLLLLSPAATFVLWPHPEAFSCALVVLSLVFWREERTTAAVAMAALASVQNAPLVLLAAYLWWDTARTTARSRGAGHQALLGPTLALLPGAWPFAFYLGHFGHLSLLTESGAAGLAHASLRKTLELFCDLNLGMLPYVPLALLGAIAAPVVQVATGRRARPLLELWAVLLVMAFMCSTSINWNHGTSGPSRYTIWMLPLVFAIFVSMLEPGVAKERVRRAFSVLAVLALGLQALTVIARGGLDPRLDYLRQSYLAAFVLERAPELYNPSPEIFVERTLGEEVAIFGQTAVVYAPLGRCRKALAQKRHWPDLLARCGPAARMPDFKQLAATHQRDEWVYVDY